jgi:hypothetical protein
MIRTLTFLFAAPAFGQIVEAEEAVIAMVYVAMKGDNPWVVRIDP